MFTLNDSFTGINGFKALFKAENSLFFWMISDDYIVGLVEGEGCFSAAIERVVDNRPRKTNKRFRKKRPSLGFHLRPSFRISISEKDVGVLEEIRERIGVGEIYRINRQKKSKKWANMPQYYVQTFKDLLKVREFFQRQTFHTTKEEDFKKWGRILEIMESGRHLYKDGFLEIVELREQMNAIGGKTTMRNIQEFKEKMFTKRGERLRQANLLHNLESCVPFLSVPLIKNSK